MPNDVHKYNAGQWCWRLNVYITRLSTKRIGIYSATVTQSQRLIPPFAMSDLLSNF